LHFVRGLLYNPGTIFNGREGGRRREPDGLWLLFSFGAAVVLILLAFGIGTLSRSRFWPSAWCPRLANTALVLLAIFGAAWSPWKACSSFFVDTTDGCPVGR